MNLSVLDIFLLTQLDRGLRSPYELQRELGISLGASLPSLRRLSKRKLITMTEGIAATKRPRHHYSLTVSGKNAARADWKQLLDARKPVTDMDSILRIADMAVHYRAEKKTIHSFLKRAADAKHLLLEQLGLSLRATRPPGTRSYPAWRARYDQSRLFAEVNFLYEIASVFTTKGEDPLLSFSFSPEQ